MSKEIGLYVHIPFCNHKCYYCDFYSIAKQDSIVLQYMECLLQEIEEVGQNLRENKDILYVKTIYIGGGTPSCIDEKYIEDIIQMLKKYYNILPDAEITIEINPGTSTIHKLEEYKKIGINRLSIGMQTVNNDTLKRIGRIHTYEEFLNCYNEARNVRI